MVLPVVKYGTPVLRKKGARIDSITPDIKKLIEDMLDTMYAFKGIGLAAQQVGIPIQLTVLDVRGVTDRPSSIEFNGHPADVGELMPLVLINPEIKPLGDAVTGPEGCLSFPEIFGEITRPEAVEVTALDVEGRRQGFRCAGLLSRAVQHEVDHLQGILFIDRMDKKTKEQLRPDLESLQAETKAALNV
jgi:peptide deformylase